jgi:hypothetical protein
MNTENLSKNQFFILLIILIITSIAISIFVYLNYIVISRGFVGIITLYLISYTGRKENMDLFIKEILIDPEQKKYIIAAFIVPAISCWATIQIFEMVMFILGI